LLVTTGGVLPEERARYSDLVDRVIALYERRQYADALADVHAVAGALPAHRSDTAHLAACLLARDGRADDALAELRGAYDDGGWWARSVLDDDDLEPLSALPGFADLVEAADRRSQEAPRSTLATVVVGALRSARAVLAVLHGANGDGPQTAPIWAPFATDGVVLVAPTSWQRTTPTHRTWLDAKTRWRDVSTVQLPSVSIVVGGFSAGGRQAMQWATDPSDLVPDAFLTVCPAIQVARLNVAAMAAAAARGVNGHVFLGAEDPGTESAAEAVDAMRSEGIEVTVELVDGLAHDYPVDFVERARPVLARLLANAPAS
jgi:dienelactone hydrolase